MALRRGQADLQLHLFGNALHPAHQPAGAHAQAHHAIAVGREIGPHGGGHGQQHLPFVAVVEQIAHANLLGHGPGDLARLQARGQIPIKLGGQARIASVFPIGVPIGLVRQQQAQRQRLARGNPLRRVHDQLGLHMGVAARSLGLADAPNTSWACAGKVSNNDSANTSHSQQRHKKETGGKGSTEDIWFSSQGKRGWFPRSIMRDYAHRLLCGFFCPFSR